MNTKTQNSRMYRIGAFIKTLLLTTFLTLSVHGVAQAAVSVTTTSSDTPILVPFGAGGPPITSTIAFPVSGIITNASVDVAVNVGVCGSSGLSLSGPGGSITIMNSINSNAGDVFIRTDQSAPYFCSQYCLNGCGSAAAPQACKPDSGTMDSFNDQTSDAAGWTLSLGTYSTASCGSYTLNDWSTTLTVLVIVDSDNDSIPDNYELLRGLDPLNASDADFDLDNDSYSNIIEYLFGSEMNDANSIPDFALGGNDSDNDGVPDSDDAFPQDATEIIDTDNDGIGNSADINDDDDGVIDSHDEMPLNPNETLDSDGDGVGNSSDAFPNDASETVDTDSDGTGNNTDTDDDNDGVVDINDTFPLDLTEWQDSDGDGFGDNSDAFPFDDTEWLDTDGDGLGDNADIDADGDGFDDNQDAFPQDASEWIDSDGDGVGDNSDTYPLDASKSSQPASSGGGGSTDPILLLMMGGVLLYLRRRQHG